MPANIQCRIFVFEITVSEYTELLLCLLSHKETYTLSTTRTFISVYCLLDVLAFVKSSSKGIKKGATAGSQGKNGCQRSSHPRQHYFREGSRREVDLTEMTL